VELGFQQKLKKKIMQLSYDELCVISSFLQQKDLFNMSLTHTSLSNIPYESVVWVHRRYLALKNIEHVRNNEKLSCIYDRVPAIVPVHNSNKRLSFYRSYVHIPSIEGYESCDFTYTAWSRTSGTNFEAPYPGLIGTDPYKVSAHFCGPAYRGSGKDNTYSFYVCDVDGTKPRSEVLFSPRIKMKKWIFTALTYCIGTGKLCMYIDGELVAESTNPITTVPDYGKIHGLSIGSVHAGVHSSRTLTDNCFEGCIYNAAVWNRVLDSEEIRRVMVDGEHSTDSLLGLWPLNDESGDVIHNYVKGGTDGNNIGCKWIDKA
jgi:hypothetical protein